MAESIRELLFEFVKSPQERSLVVFNKLSSFLYIEMVEKESLPAFLSLRIAHVLLT